ncbi:MAG: putative membrane-bound dehydrogenase-like protein [Rhodothermales bacterium]|jgi:putative membrane-bound dehydrogenase-like protein
MLSYPMRALLLITLLPLAAYAELSAGVAVVDVTPRKLPVIANGGFVSRLVSQIKTPLKARALALSDGDSRIVIVVVDSCMMPRPLLDAAKAQATERFGIPRDRILISATHTHSAGSCMGALGTNADPDYTPQLREQLTEAIGAALAALQPAQIAFGRTDAPAYTALRRWIRRPDRIETDPFGETTVRANMHAGKNLDDVTGESGPEDPELSFIALQTRAGAPLALLANFSMHYFSGERGISADYFGLFADGLEARSGYLGIMSHGCSGDIWRRDYRQPDTWQDFPDIQTYANGLVDHVLAELPDLSFRHDSDLAMAEQRMVLPFRVPSSERLAWARGIVAEMGARPPKTKPEVYAREQIILHERQSTEIVVQALRIGDIAIATTPNETYAISGLHIKAKSPLSKTMVIELANGGDGYIPPPEQHHLGGYNTWAARSAGLEEQAEPKIVESCLSLLEQVSAKPRRQPEPSRGPLAQAIAKLKPQTWNRLHGFHSDERFTAGVVHYLTGPPGFCVAPEINRSAMFAGGHMRAEAPTTPEWSIALWIWNGMPDGSGTFLPKVAVHVPRWTWAHVALVKAGDQLQIYLNGSPKGTVPALTGPLRFGDGWEGRLDEIAIFNRALSVAEIATLVPSTDTGRSVTGENLLPRAEPWDWRRSQAAWQIDGDFELQLVAAEPLVRDPVDVAWDAQGRMFVAEMPDYPDGNGQGRIRLLLDSDGDGRYDSARTWADNLPAVQGLLPHDGGLLATCADGLLFIKDGERRLLLKANPARHSQLQIASPRWRLDNRIHINNGIDGKAIGKLDFRRKNLSFDPFSGDLRTSQGLGQFGAAIDAYGRIYYCSNRNPAMLTVIPGVGHEDIQSPAAPVYPIELSHTTAAAHAGTHTSACGLAIHQGELFVCDPTAQLITRNRLEPHGASFRAIRIGEGRDFLASADEWCRPVNLRSGPDGALYICDMYRRFIDHATYFPKPFVASHDMRAGQQQGRIWRLIRKGQALPPITPLAADLVSELASPIAWRRIHAQRLLVGRGQIPDTLTDATRSANPMQRLHALWALRGLGAPTPDLSEDPDPGVLESSLIPTHLRSPHLRIRVLAAAKYLDQFPVADLANFLLQDGLDPWARRAVQPRIRELLPALTKAPIALQTAIALELKGQKAPELQAVYAQAERRAADSNLPLAERLDALQLLSSDEARWRFITAEQPPEIQAAAVRGLRKPAELLARWTDLPPAARSEAVPCLPAVSLLQAVQDGIIPKAAVPQMTRWVLCRGTHKKLARKLFGQTNPDRQAVIDRYQNLPVGDPARGKALFTKAGCTVCHPAAGPELCGVRNKPSGSLLIDILDPNRVVEARYTAYTVTTKSGASHHGIILAESATELQLALPGGGSQAIPRTDIARFDSTGVSLMPEGLEAALSPSDMADLLAYLKEQD